LLGPGSPRLRRYGRDDDKVGRRRGPAPGRRRAAPPRTVP